MQASGWGLSSSRASTTVDGANGGTVYLALERSTGLPVGFCRAVRSPFGGIWIHELCVTPNYRRRGVASDLLKQVICDSDGSWLAAWCIGESPKLFRRFGFRRSGARVYFMPTES